MLLKGSRPQVVWRFSVWRGIHYTSLSCRMPEWSFKGESTSPAVTYACRDNYSYSHNVEQPQQMMPSQCPHPVTSPSVQTVWSLAHCQKHHKRGPTGNSQPPPAKRHFSVAAAAMDYSQRWSSIPSKLGGRNSTLSSSQTNSRVADITQSTTQWQSINIPTATAGTISSNTPVPSGTSQTESTRQLVPSPESGIASTPTPLSGCENLPTPIPNPDACVIITNSLRTRTAEKYHWQGQCLDCDQWSPVMLVSIEYVTPTQWVEYWPRADSWSSTCGTPSRLWVHTTCRR